MPLCKAHSSQSAAMSGARGWGGIRASTLGRIEFRVGTDGQHLPVQQPRQRVMRGLLQIQSRLLSENGKEFVNSFVIHGRSLGSDSPSQFALFRRSTPADIRCNMLRDKPPCTDSGRRCYLSSPDLPSGSSLWQLVGKT